MKKTDRDGLIGFARYPYEDTAERRRWVYIAVMLVAAIGGNVMLGFGWLGGSAVGLGGFLALLAVDVALVKMDVLR